MNYSSKLNLRIDWGDIDLFGHVNNVAIMKYVQAARVSFLETIGLMQLQQEAKMGPILASVHCQFRTPLFYPGEVNIYSDVDLIKNTSFEIYHIICDGSGKVAAETKDIIVYFDFIKNKKVLIPIELRTKIERLERKYLVSEKH